MPIGYNPMLEFNKMAISNEEKIFNKMHALKAEYDVLDNKITKISQLLQLVYNQRGDTSKNGKEPIVDFYNDPVAMNLVAEVRKIADVEHNGEHTSFLKEGEYSWNGQSAVDALIRGLEEQNKLLTQEIQPIFLQLTNEQEYINHAYDSWSRGLRDTTESIHHFQSNTAKVI